MNRALLSRATGLLLCCCASVQANEPVQFENDIAPILERRCVTCHNPQKQAGGLSLDTRASLLAGGDSGPAVRAGAPKVSRLLRMVAGPDAKMPKKGDKLSDDAIVAIRNWITDGADWPRDRTLDVKSFADETWWSFQPIEQPDVPSVTGPGADRLRNPIDAFVLSRLHKSGLSFAPDADRSILVRRLCFDLIGLPPTPAQVDAFVADKLTCPHGLYHELC